jgi:hypothetical protein
MRTIGYDLVNVSPFNQGPMPTNVPQPPRPPSSSVATGTGVARVAAAAAAAAVVAGAPAATTVSPPPSALRSLLQPPAASPSASPDVARLARLILAEEELHIRTGKYSPDADGGAGATREVDTADLIQSVVKESIIAEAFKPPHT